MEIRTYVPTKCAGTFSLWGMGYIDKSWVDKIKPDEWETLYDQNNEQVRQKLFTVGLLHKILRGFAKCICTYR